MSKFLLPALAAGFLCLSALAGTAVLRHPFDLGLPDTVTGSLLRYNAAFFSVAAAGVDVAEVAVVPEPDAYPLSGAGLMMLALLRRRA